MESRKTKSCNIVFRLEGGDESNNLHGYRGHDTAGNNVCCGVFVPNEEERAAIASGYKIVVAIWGDTVPPMDIVLLDDPEVEPQETLASGCHREHGCDSHAECASAGYCTYIYK